MPQREFWAQRVAVTFRVDYRCDVTDPDKPGVLHLSILDQSGDLMEASSISVPADETLELVQTALVEAWQGYLFGDRYAAGRALQAVASRFRRSRRMRHLRSL